MEQGAREIIKGARGKIKKDQGAKRDEKGAVKIGKKERAQKNGREQGEWGKNNVEGSREHRPHLTEPPKRGGRNCRTGLPPDRGKGGGESFQCKQ